MSNARRRFVLERRFTLIGNTATAKAPWGLGDWHRFGRYASKARAMQAMHDGRRKREFLKDYYRIEWRIVELMEAQA